MGITFNASEVLEMAVRMEQNGAKFYRRAAELKKDDESVDFLLSLAEMEEKHEKTFTDMKQNLSDSETESNTYDPSGETGMYLAAMVDSRNAEGAPQAAEKLTGKETLREILDTAIGLEKESILFYLGIKDMVPEHFGKSSIDTIISEERQHVVTLSKKRGGL